MKKEVSKRLYDEGPKSRMELHTEQPRKAHRSSGKERPQLAIVRISLRDHVDSRVQGIVRHHDTMVGI